MSRVQLALNVSDIDQAIDFYSRAFHTKPAKVRDGYANFAIDEPPLKLVLIQSGIGGTLNHLGVEVETSAEVANMSRRLVGEGLTTSEELGVECCYARQDKVWANDPDGAPWEWYTVLEDTESMHGSAACC